MKKLFAILLTMALFASMATVASAANTTTLTTRVPAATYTLNIPADKTIAYGRTSTEIGTLSVTGATGFASGKNLKVTISFDPFKCETTSTQIPISLEAKYTQQDGSNSAEFVEIANGSSLQFYGKENGSVDSPRYIIPGTSHTYWLDTISVCADSKDWGKALAGEYTTTITFTAEVVA